MPASPLLFYLPMNRSSTFMSPRSDAVDINTVLRLGNFLLLPIAFLAVPPSEEAARYIDGSTIAIFCVFSLVNHVLLEWERRIRDPLLLLVMLTIVPFYMFRVVTLLYDPDSYVLPRFESGVIQLNYSLLYIMASVLSITTGLKLASLIDVPRNNDQARLFSQKRWAWLAIAVIALQLTSIVDLAVLGRFTGLLRTIFNFNFLLVVSFIGLHHVSAGRTQYAKRIVLVVVFVAFAFNTFSGARSAAMTLLLLFVFYRLSVLGFLAVRIKWLVAFCFTLPVLVLIFGIATSFRYVRMAIGLDDYGKTVSIVTQLPQIISENFEVDRLRSATSTVLNRVAYLDMATDIIANGDRYSKVISLEYYGKSLVDNLLTPGFDVFDVPRAAQALKSIYLGTNIPTKSEVEAEYHSDNVTIFGEYHTLFGPYAAQAFFIISGVLFGVLFRRWSAATFGSHVKKAVLLGVFLNWLWTFGLDWIVIETVFLLVTYFVTMQIVSRSPRLALSANHPNQMKAFAESKSSLSAAKLS